MNSRKRVRCGDYNYCDLTSQWCDSVLGDCNRCDLPCANPSHKIAPFCNKHCAEYMKTREVRETSSIRSSTTASLAPLSTMIAVINNHDVINTTSSLNLSLLVVILCLTVALIIVTVTGIAVILYMIARQRQRESQRDISREPLIKSDAGDNTENSNIPTKSHQMNNDEDSENFGLITRKESTVVDAEVLYKLHNVSIEMT